MNEQFAAAKKVLQSLEDAGYEAFLVGGCVRDNLLGKEPADYDITTNALPNEIIKVFPRTIPTGIKHGTISVIQNKTVIEVTTYRVEGNYEDHRRPNEVQFVSQLKDDLMRRDFTINAMAMNRKGNVIDYVNGRDDLRTGIIRTVGKAENRFEEDALRMLRACRFASQLSFSIDESTMKAIQKCKSYANHLAVERIVAEFEKIWRSSQPSNGLRPLLSTNLILDLPPFHFQTIEPNITEVEWNNLDVFSTSLERWVYFLYLIFRRSKNHQQVCRKDLISILPKFKFSNHDKRAIASIVILIDEWDITITEEQGKLLLLKYQLNTVLVAEQIWEKITKRKSNLPLQKWWEQMPIHQLSELAINGNDLLRVTGKAAGPWLKKTLQYLYHQVVFGHLPNVTEVLEKEGGEYGAGLTS
jgi:tRNA nucleotidyltransferase (CCA-adding enzyme)